MRKSGVDLDKTVYAIHRQYELDERRINDILSRGYNYLGLSLAKAKRIRGKNRDEFVREIMSKIDDVKGLRFHFFGVGELKLLYEHRPYSADVSGRFSFAPNNVLQYSDGSQQYVVAKDDKSKLDNTTFLLGPDDIFYMLSSDLDDYVKNFEVIRYMDVRAYNYYKVLEKITSDDMLNSIFKKAMTQNYFNETFYKKLGNYLFSLEQDVEVFNTPRRWVNALTEYLSGYKYDAYSVVGKTFENVVDSNKNEKIVVKVPFSSLCIHHLLPFYGNVNITYIPSNKILGVSKFSRLVYVLSRRLQLQEGLTEQIYNVLYDVLEPKFLAVKVRAKHLCCRDRGIRTGSIIETEVRSDGSGENRKE